MKETTKGNDGRSVSSREVLERDEERDEWEDEGKEQDENGGGVAMTAILHTIASDTRV